jgi:hypothetical protein
MIKAGELRRKARTDGVGGMIIATFRRSSSSPNQAVWLAGCRNSAFAADRDFQPLANFVIARHHESCSDRDSHKLTPRVRPLCCLMEITASAAYLV